MSEARRIEERAAFWVMRQGEPDWSAAEQAERDAWLAESMAHKAAFWRLEHGWREADRIGALGDAPQVPPRASWVTRHWRPLAIAASLLLAIGIGAAWLMPDMGPGSGLETAAQRYATAVGGRRIIALPDGSRVELNTATEVRSAVTPDSRIFWLDRGEAYFEVAHDKSRPFLVHAGSKTVTVLGTKFSVRREGDRVEVAVVEGRVRVSDSRPGRSPVPSPDLTKGEIVIAQGPSTLVAEKSVDRVASELGWRQGVIYFDQSTLGEAAREFNRYNRKQVVVGDADLARMRIGGNFEATNVDAFLRLLQQAYGLKIDDDGAVARISS